jgi:ribonuclease HI
MSRRKRKEQKEVAIYLNNKPVPQVQRLKYLGIIFDRKLSFKEHINYIANKCTKLIFSLSKAAKLNWGLNNKALKTIYLGGILPLLLYGAPVWIKVMELESCKTKLIRVQRLINIKMAKAYRTVSNEALCILTGMTPIAIKIQEAAQLYNLTKGNTSEEAQIDSNMAVKHWLHPAETMTSILEDNDERSPIQIYTDGSKTEKGVGAGIAIFASGHHIKSFQCRLNKRCTNNQAEQLAVLTALKYAANMQTTDKTATVYTDSQITLDSLRNCNIHTYLIEEIRKTLNEMTKTNWTIKLQWVKAHAGIIGNELADTLAKEAAANENIKESYKRVPKSVVLSELKNRSVEKWQSEWTQSAKGRTTKEFFPEVTERLKMKINFTQNFTTMVTGHGKTKAYLHRFKIIDTPTCPCGTGDQTIDHLLFECKLLNEERNCLKQLILKTNDWPISKRDLIRKYFKEFTKFTNKIPFDEINVI